MVANLKRYDLKEILCFGEYDHIISEQADGEYVKFEEAAEASSNSLQQLKAEILPLSESGIRYCNANGLGSVKSIFERIAAKLSAV